jgi:hypothetical protein
MPPALTAGQMSKLDGTFNFTYSENCEIADLWFIMSVRANYTTAFPLMEKFLSSVGRRKFIEPLYGEMMKTPKGAAMAKKLYEKDRKNYHPLAQESLDKMIFKK